MRFDRRSLSNVWGVSLALACLSLALLLGVKMARGSSNISTTSSEHMAWSDVISWIQFNDVTGSMNVNVYSAKLEGYASSSAGEFSLDCATSPIGDICGTSNYYVENNGLGRLSGFGWNDIYGWVSFCGGDGTANCPGAVAYGVLIDENTGVFTNYAWNDILGWISFNCSNHGGCGTVDYKVKTSWFATSTSGYLDSSTFDTGSAQGAQINSIMWKGNPSSGRVGFQLAASDSSGGPWDFFGPDGTNLSYYEPAVNTTMKLDYELYNGKRYFRYRATLFSDKAQLLTPQVDEVIVNWSP